jgi:molecular chaperone GrpE (heat shock protein)
LAEAIREITKTRLVANNKPSREPVPTNSQKRTVPVPVAATAVAVAIVLSALVAVLALRTRAAKPIRVTERVEVSQGRELFAMRETAERIAQELGELHSKSAQLAGSLDVAGGTAWSSEKALDEKLKQTVECILWIADKTDDMVAALTPVEGQAREQLEFVQELIRSAIRSAGLDEMKVQVGAPYEIGKHEPIPEVSEQPSGMVLRVARKGYLRRAKVGQDARVFRPAKVYVSKPGIGGQSG